MKKLLSLVISLTMVLSLAVPAFAAAPLSEGNVECRQLTFEEVVLKKMKYDNISYEAAKEQLLDEENRILTQIGMNEKNAYTNSMRSNFVQYVEYSKEFDFPDNSEFSCAINVTIRTYSDFGHTRWIDEVVMMSTRRVSGRYSYEWIEEDKTSIISADKKSVKLMAMGHFSVTTSKEINASVELPGFSVGSSSGGTYLYLSNTMRPTGTYCAP